MSPLCDSSNYKQYLTTSKRPSPTKSTDLCPALDKGIVSSKGKNYIKVFFSFIRIKEISLFTSRKWVAASMTVEAAVVLPLLMFFLINLCSIIEMIRLHGNMELALTNMGNTLSIYRGVEELTGATLSQIYIQNRIENYLGKEYLQQAPFSGGKESTPFIGWNLEAGEDILEIHFSYKVGCPYAIPGFSDFYMTNRYYSHVWNGYGIPGAEDGTGLETVFLTENASVYHLTMECTHLDLSIRETELQEALQSRNEEGDKYVLCGFCEDEPYEGVTYITDLGDCYHYRRDCTGLKRTIYSVTLAEARDLEIGPCSRCYREAGG